MWTSNIGRGVHILVFPFPAQGHMLPLLDLTHQLALRGLTITILVTPKNLPLLHPLLSKHPSIQTLILPFPTTNGSIIPPGVENMKNLALFYFPAMMLAMSELYNPLLHWFQSQKKSSSSSTPPVAILSDIFLGWTHHLACQLDIPRIVFVTTSAYTLSISRYLWGNLPKKEDCKDPCYPISASNVPTSPTFPLYEIFSFYGLLMEERDPNWVFIRDNNSANRMSWGTIVNSFAELEEPFLNHLKKELGGDRVWAVGPLQLPIDQNESLTEPIERGGRSSVRVEQVMSWLDSRADRSVVYVCFGSQIGLNKQQMEALAMGLEESGAHFIWCIKASSSSEVASDGDNTGVVEVDPPAGFEERVGYRGLVIKGWAPQVPILSHQAVAAFLTHSGWNSVLEGLMAGVRLLSWPMGADNFMNAKLLGEVLGVGITVCEGANTVPDPTQLARVIAESVGLGETRPEMIRSMEMRKLGLEAVKEGGSSFKCLNEFVGTLRELNDRRKDTF